MSRKTVRRTYILALVLAAAAGLLAGDSMVGDPKEACAQSLPTGCVAGGTSSVTEGAFDANNFDLLYVSVNASGNLSLDTGNQALDPNSIIIPFTQDINAYFIFEAAGHKSTFGWFVKDLAETWLANIGKPVTGSVDFRDLAAAHVAYKAATGNELVNYLFPYVQDDNNNGIFDYLYNPTSWSIVTSRVSHTQTKAGAPSNEAEYQSLGYFSPNFDGTLDARDSRASLGTIAGGTEIVFFLQDDRWWGSTWYSKYAWNQYNATSSPYTMSAEIFQPSTSASPLCSGNRKRNHLNTSTSVPKKMKIGFYLDKSPPENSGCTNVSLSGAGTAEPVWMQGLIQDSARTRLSTLFGITFTGVAGPYSYTLGQNFNHFVVVAPPADPFKWIVGVEDWHGTEASNDYDFNDTVFLIERKTGGTAQLKSTQALSPSDADAYITSVTFATHDKMPGASCGAAAGATQIKYYLSIDNGATWVEIMAADWDIIKTPDKNGADVAGWTYGSPEETWRQVTVNFIEQGLTGRELIWKAEMISENEACVPEILAVEMAFDAAKNAMFSRSSPSVLSNVIYDASFETPAATWTERVLRGHLTSTRLYDPTNYTSGYSTSVNWDAGQVLTASNPSTRNVIFPDMTITAAVNEIIGTGDGATTTFTGAFANHPIIHSTISITDGTETFVDRRTSVLEGSLTGTGTINRFTGDFSITFNSAPGNGVPIMASYQWYTFSSTMIAFDTSNVNKDMLALDNSTYVDGTGTHYTYDFNASDTFEEADADWLVNWTRGYVDGVSTKKEWLLGAIDHSTPAVIGAPGLPSWYYGVDVTDDDRFGFDQFRCLHRKRKTVAFVGTRAGFLHGFYAGEYRPYHVDETLLNAGDPCGEGTAANLDLFRGVMGTQSTGAVNTNTINDARTGNKVPVFPGNSVTGAMQMIISRGYYDWVTRAGASVSDAGAPNYGTGAELYAILPLNLLGKLKNNALDVDEQAAVDASPAVAHVKFQNASGNPWKTVLISAEGNGGDTVFGIDVTNPDSPLFLWEFADPDLYRSRSSPAVGVIGRIWSTTGARWVTFFVSGINKEPALYPSIYMLDVETGEALDRIYLDSTALGVGGTPSGQPAVVDSDGNGFIDRMYIGTDKGFMYKITLPDKPDTTSAITVCTLFDAGQPIYASPAVMVRNTTSATGETQYKIDLFFGTSDSPYQVDSTGNTYYFYAVRDDDVKGSCSAGTMLWSMALPPGHRVFASAFATAGRVYFGTTTADTEDPCSPAATGATDTGMIYALDVLTDEMSPTVVFSEEVGNITTTPVVEDQHLYIKTGNGDLEGRGGNDFQNELKKGGFGVATVSSWSEVFSD